jgi:hypothetical protein
MRRSTCSATLSNRWVPRPVGPARPSDRDRRGDRLPRITVGELSLRRDGAGRWQSLSGLSAVGTGRKSLHPATIRLPRSGRPQWPRPTTAAATANRSAVTGRMSAVHHATLPGSGAGLRTDSSYSPHSRIDTGQRVWLRLVTVRASAEPENGARSELRILRQRFPNMMPALDER